MSTPSAEPGSPPPSPNHGSKQEDQEPIWTFRGYELDSGHFTTAMVHFFRAEINRANVWRQRLDATTNWAVITTGAAISIAFTEAVIGHLVILLSTLLITLFLMIEARRYRYYELWSYRVRLMETDFFAAMLVPPFKPAPDWAETLAENLLHPDFPISMWEAFGRRLRRNFVWMYAVLGMAWFLKIWLHPTQVTTLTAFFERVQIGPIPGVVVVAAGLAFYLALAIIALLTLGLHEATGEVLPRFMEPEAVHAPDQAKEVRKRAWFRPSRRRRQYLALIVSDLPEQISERLLHEMSRGVTSLAAVGMYTNQPHSVLLCALTVTEVPQLKALVYEVDPTAFVVVSPAHEVLGGGFAPLQPEET